jgi:hypothetical protein
MITTTVNRYNILYETGEGNLTVFLDIKLLALGKTLQKIKIITKKNPTTPSSPKKN